MAMKIEENEWVWKLKDTIDSTTYLMIERQ